MKPYDHTKNKYSEAIGIEYETDRRNALALFDAITRRITAPDADHTSVRSSGMAREIITELNLSNRELASACLRVLMSSTGELELTEAIAANVLALLYLDRDKALPVAVTAARIAHDVLASESYSEACESIENIIADGWREEVMIVTITTAITGAASQLASEVAEVQKGVTIQ